MNENLLILIVEAIAVYFLVLTAHSLRHKFGLYHFYALVGGLTAIMSWVTDAGVEVEAFGITFVVGSTVFYTSLLLSVFVIYVFDGPRATRIAISTVILVSVLVPVISVIINLQMGLSDVPPTASIPMPSLRINSASVLTTAVDLIFLAISWEFFGNLKVNMRLWLRAYLTLLGVMVIDVLLFNTGAFLGNPDYLFIMQGTLYSRVIISIFAFPFLLVYIYFQNSKPNVEVETRPVLSILKQVAKIEHELNLAKEELKSQKKIEEAIRISLDKHKRLNERLGKEKSMKELLLDVIVHDLRNPAGVIKGIAVLLRDEYPEDDMVELVDQSIENLMEVIDNAASLSRITDGESISKTDQNLTSLLKKAVGEYENIMRAAKIKLTNNVTDDIIVRANPIIIEVFKNYLSNSAKYSAKGNKLTISSKINNNEVTIEFADFGDTIPEQERKVIFNRNVRLNDSTVAGGGIGLAIVQNIAYAHDAEVGVRPNQPNGNIFYFKMKMTGE